MSNVASAYTAPIAAKGDLITADPPAVH